MRDDSRSSLRGYRPLIAAIFTLLVSIVLFACGPFFPEELLTQGDAAVLTAPVANWVIEMRKITPATSQPFVAVNHDDSRWRRPLDPLMFAAEIDSVALVIGDTSPATERYRRVRESLSEKDVPFGPRTQPDASQEDLASSANIDGLTDEFIDYLSGLVALRRGDSDRATAAWQQLLARPIDERRNRTLWATFALAQINSAGDPDRAVEWFHKTRELAATKQFKDIDGFAAASLGLEARIELNRKHFVREVELYLEQQAAGDRTATASLMFTALAILKGDTETLAAAATDSKSREVVDVFLLSHAAGARGLNFNCSLAFGPWLKAIEDANVTDDAHAEQFAWIAYQAADFIAAQKWVDRAPANSTIATWLRAKLLLRAGKLDAATEQLALVIRDLKDARAIALCGPAYRESYWIPTDSEPALNHAIGELGVVQLSRGQYAESLHLLLSANYFQDAAYIAEQVLSVDELKHFVDTAELTTQRALPSKRSPWQAPDAMRWLRNLLARRLMRAHRDAEATRYFEDSIRSVYDNYEHLIALGNDKSLSAADRGRAIASAARTLRKSGGELCGTELEPDWETDGGNYDRGTAADHRSYNGKPAKIIPPTPDESNRVSHVPKPKFRWHYRYLAAELAWRAAGLMPDNEDETASILRDAGSWLKARDPAAAEEFYRALILRCPNTSIGKQAKSQSWIP